VFDDLKIVFYSIPFFKNSPYPFLRG